MTILESIYTVHATKICDILARRSLKGLWLWFVIVVARRSDDLRCLLWYYPIHNELDWTTRTRWLS